MLQDRMQSPAASSPNSPRLEFQSRVRKLQLPHSPSRPSLGKHRRTHSELEHVSTLRVTHKRSRSAQPAPQDTPDFLAEEREAWGQRSPESSHLQMPFPEGATASPSRPKLQPFPPRNSIRVALQPRKQPQERAPLQSFAPLHTITDVDERPKTSRGPRKLEILEEENEDPREGQSDQGNEHDEDGVEDDVLRFSVGTQTNNRTSKFIEGSMNERSSGIASSWFREALSDNEKPLPPTPAVKHVTFSCTPVPDPLGDNQEPVPELPTTTKHKERRGLRKSISNFNFQALSEKMKIFSGSEHEAAAVEPVGRKKPVHKSDSTRLDILNERKRKAEEAYAAQFGSKKQRFSAPPSSTNLSNGQSSLQGQVRNMDHTSDFRTSTPTSTSRPDLRKKKSRRELERENAELRARLDAQQNLRSIQQQRHLSEEGVPPVPKVPGRGVLKVLENMKPNSDSREAASLGEKRKSAIKSSGGGEGLKDDAGSKVAPLLLAKSYARSPNANIAANGRKSFEWPEDVF